MCSIFAPQELPRGNPLDPWNGTSGKRTQCAKAALQRPHAGHLNSWKLLEILYPRTGVDFPRQHIHFHSMRAEFQQAEAKINNYTKEERRQRLTGPEPT